MKKVNLKASLEHEYIKNYKVLQEFFDKKRINKVIEIEKLIKARQMDNLEFLQAIHLVFSRSYSEVAEEVLGCEPRLDKAVVDWDQGQRE
jgi:hypothetical protein